MPIRSPRGRAAAYRALWQWPLRSPARLVVTLVAVIVVGSGASLGVAALGGGGAPSAGLLAVDRETAPPTTAEPFDDALPEPTALPPVPELTPSALPLDAAPPAALDVAARWSAAWVNHPAGVTSAQWVEALRPLTTDEYLGVLAGVDPANVPADAVTGPPQPVRVAARSVQVEVPTDALRLRVLVVDTEDGWRVAGHDRA